MQDLILLDTKNVKVQAQDKIYEDTLANFKKVYAKDIPYKYIDYNRDCATCYLDNKPFQNYPNSVCEDILSSINVLLDAQTKRNTTPENTEEKEGFLPLLLRKTALFYFSGNIISILVPFPYSLST